MGTEVLCRVLLTFVLFSQYTSKVQASQFIFKVPWWGKKKKPKTLDPVFQMVKSSSWTLLLGPPLAEIVFKLWSIRPLMDDVLVCRVGGCLIPHITRTAEDRAANSFPQPSDHSSQPPYAWRLLKFRSEAPQLQSTPDSLLRVVVGDVSLQQKLRQTWWCSAPRHLSHANMQIRNIKPLSTGADEKALWSLQDSRQFHLFNVWDA